MSQFNLNAVQRSENEQGKGASRRLRKSNLVPAIVYGGKGEPTSVAVKYNELVKALEDEAFFSSIIELNIDGNTEEVVIKALQRHPAKNVPVHADFQRIVRGQLMNFHVPVHVVNESVSVGKKAGGVLSTLVNDIEVSCLPRNLPEAIEVDVTDLAVGSSIHLGELKLPADVSLVLHDSEDSNRVIVTMQAPTVAKEDTASEE